MREPSRTDEVCRGKRAGAAGASGPVGPEVEAAGGGREVRADGQRVLPRAAAVVRPQLAARAHATARRGADRDQPRVFREPGDGEGRARVDPMPGAGGVLGRVDAVRTALPGVASAGPAERRGLRPGRLRISGRGGAEAEALDQPGERSHHEPVGDDRRRLERRPAERRVEDAVAGARVVADELRVAVDREPDRVARDRRRAVLGDRSQGDAQTLRLAVGVPMTALRTCVPVTA